MKKLLKERGVIEHITFAGLLTGKDKLESFAGSDIFVLASYSENFGVAVAEAMACKLPVVISNEVGIHREVAEAAAGIVVNPNEQELFKALTKLLNNPVLCEQMGTTGRRLVEEKFADKGATQKMFREIKDIINP